MRKILLITLLVICPRLMDAQKLKNNGLSLPENGVIAVSFIYDQAMINYTSYSDFCERNTDFETDKFDAETRFIGTLNDNFDKYNRFQKKFHKRKMSFFHKGDDIPSIELILIPSSINNNGDFAGSAMITDNNGNTAVIENLHGKGGKWGSFVNLMGDGYQSVAEKIYKIIVRAVQKGEL